MENGKEEPVEEKKERNRPTTHNEHWLTEKQQAFAIEIAKWKSGKDAAIAAYWEEVKYPTQLASNLRNKAHIQRYLMEQCGELLDIQMEMIKEKRTPAAVRNDAIKFRLQAAGIGKDDGEETDPKKFSIGDIVINVVK